MFVKSGIGHKRKPAISFKSKSLFFLNCRSTNGLSFHICSKVLFYLSYGPIAQQQPCKECARAAIVASVEENFDLKPFQTAARRSFTLPHHIKSSCFHFCISFQSTITAPKLKYKRARDCAAPMPSRAWRQHRCTIAQPVEIIYLTQYPWHERVPRHQHSYSRRWYQCIRWVFTVHSCI